MTSEGNDFKGQSKGHSITYIIAYITSLHIYYIYVPDVLFIIYYKSLYVFYI